jgi:enterochelin esterase-like enzyme
VVTPDAPVIEPTMPITPTATPHVLVGRVEEHAYPSQVTGTGEIYRIYLPPNYDQTDRRYPVLYLLHGWPIAPADWDTIGAAELADELIVNGILPPFVIVMPRSTEGIYIRTCGGTYSFEAQLINDLMPHIDATYRSWPAREGRGIGGISRGGVWSLEISFMHTDIFGIVGAHSPALSVNMAPPACDPFYLLTRPEVASLRIYLDAGDADWARRGTEQLHQKLDENGIVHAYTVHPGRHDRGLWGSALGEYLLFYASSWWEVPQ